MTRNNELAAALRMEDTAEGYESDLLDDGQAALENEEGSIEFDQLPVSYEPKDNRYPKVRAEGIGKRAMAGLNSIADRADVRFRILSIERIKAPSGYGDFDVVYKLKTVRPKQCLGELSGRSSEMSFNVTIHVTGSRYIESYGLYLKSFSEVTLKVWSRNSKEVMSTFVGNPRSYAPAHEALDRIERRFAYEQAFRDQVEILDF